MGVSKAEGYQARGDSTEDLLMWGLHWGFLPSLLKKLAYLSTASSPPHSSLLRCEVWDILAAKPEPQIS